MIAKSNNKKQKIKTSKLNVFFYVLNFFVEININYTNTNAIKENLICHINGNIIYLLSINKKGIKRIMGLRENFCKNWKRNLEKFGWMIIYASL